MSFLTISAIFIIRLQFSSFICALQLLSIIAITHSGIRIIDLAIPFAVISRQLPFQIFQIHMNFIEFSSRSVREFPGLGDYWGQHETLN